MDHAAAMQDAKWEDDKGDVGEERGANADSTDTNVTREEGMFVVCR